MSAQNEILVVESAKRTLRTEMDALHALHDALSSSLQSAFQQLVQQILNSSGRVIVTGIGKSGHVGGKLAATLSSTGTAAYFVHANEASHGDLGMIRSDDIIIALSWSGETAELSDIIAYSRRFRITLAAITSRRDSTLAKAADIQLVLPAVSEACPHNLAPTASTIMQMALGDSLAVSLLDARGFTAQHFRDFHPGGRLGAQLRRAADIMHQGDKLPLADSVISMDQAILAMSAAGFGILGLVDGNGRLEGVITDGDLRRAMGADLLSKPACEVMTRDPLNVASDMLVASVLEFLNRERIMAVFVVEEGRPVGLIHMHDLLRIGAI